MPFHKTKRNMAECCSICSEALQETNRTKTTCGHEFHFSCLFTWAKQHCTCPMCRHTLGEADANDASSDSSSDGNLAEVVAYWRLKYEMERDVTQRLSADKERYKRLLKAARTRAQEAKDRAEAADTRAQQANDRAKAADARLDRTAKVATALASSPSLAAAGATSVKKAVVTKTAAPPKKPVRTGSRRRPHRHRSST